MAVMAGEIAWQEISLNIMAVMFHAHNHRNIEYWLASIYEMDDYLV